MRYHQHPSTQPVPLVELDFRFLAHYIGETATHTLDSSHRELHIPLSIDVRVKHTQNMLELRGQLEALRSERIPAA
jgi:hypothetical protein